ncbi:Na/Pi cotransporter family protein [Enterococcus hailinensis]|uniref:Na/Pi cotransporter family protein n=1 Tax=Enterococcus hailinensis TaxID=3238988 RepID=UPI0038B3994E
MIFNLIGAIIFTLLLSPFTQLVLLFTKSFGLNPAMQIAFAHGLFNVSNLALQFWFIPQIEQIVKRIVPGSEKNLNIRSITLSEPIIYTSSVMAIEQAKSELIQMGNYALSSVKSAHLYYNDTKDEWRDDVFQYEEAINQCDIELTDYLVKISAAELTPLESQEQAMLLEFTKDFERIGDHSMNIIRYIEESIALEEKQRVKDRKAKKFPIRTSLLLQDEDLETLFAKVQKNIHDALSILENDDIHLAQKMLDREESINQLVELLRKKYITLMTKGEGRASDGVLLIDISSNLERTSDRTLHIAKYFLGNKYNFKYDTTNFQYEAEQHAKILHS